MSIAGNPRPRSERPSRFAPIAIVAGVVALFALFVFAPRDDASRPAGRQAQAVQSPSRAADGAEQGPRLAQPSARVTVPEGPPPAWLDDPPPPGETQTRGRPGL